MRLVSDDGSSFELRVLGYQFPTLEEDFDDSNWLNVHVDVTSPEGRWERTEPCMMTHDLTRLADWFETIALDRVKDDTCDFLEPCLSFKLEATDPRGSIIRALFELEFRPPWDESDEVFGDSYEVRLRVDRAALRDAATSLREQLVRFPQRGQRP